MSLYGDPDELDKLARALRRRAEEVRRAAADHVRAANTARWVSLAASAYRERIARDAADAERAAAELERVARMIEAHARHVRRTIEQIARFEEEVSGWFSRQLQVVGRLVADPPWSSWPFSPQALPAAGDVKWLEVGKFLRARGVL